MAASKSLESRIVTLQGPGGEFGMAFDGAHRDGLHFLYRDSKHQFFFYADTNPTPIWTITIEFADRLTVSRDEANRIESNIEFFFKTRDYLRPEREVSFVKVVTFRWRIVR